MTNQEALFSSLVGSGVIELVPRSSILENEMGKRVLPTVPYLFNKKEVAPEIKNFEPFNNLWQADKPTPEAEQFFPLKLSIDNGKTWFLLPYEPMINISGKNQIIKRTVYKWHPTYSKNFFGTIKERWGQGDYKIQITGFLMGAIMKGSVEDCFPKDDFVKLKTLLTSGRVAIACEPLLLLGITYIAVEEFTFPFTKGENVQAYDIRCVSDTSFELLIEEKEPE